MINFSGHPNSSVLPFWNTFDGSPTYDTVKTNELVDEGRRRNLPEDPEERDIDRQYHANSEYSKPVQEIFIHSENCRICFT